MRKCYLSRKSFTYEIYAGTSKAAHKVFQQRGVYYIRECSLLHSSLVFAWKLSLKVLCSSIRDAASIRCIMVNKVWWYFNVKCSI